MIGKEIWGKQIWEQEVWGQKELWGQETWGQEIWGQNVGGTSGKLGTECGRHLWCRIRRTGTFSPYRQLP